MTDQLIAEKEYDYQDKINNHEQLVSVIVRIDNKDRLEWCPIPQNYSIYVVHSNGYEAIYISNHSKLYKMRSFNTYIMITMTLEEIQLADVSPELRPRVEEELNKLKAEQK